MLKLDINSRTIQSVSELEQTCQSLSITESFIIEHWVGPQSRSPWTRSCRLALHYLVTGESESAPALKKCLTQKNALLEMSDLCDVRLNLLVKLYSRGVNGALLRTLQDSNPLTLSLRGDVLERLINQGLSPHIVIPMVNKMSLKYLLVITNNPGNDLPDNLAGLLKIGSRLGDDVQMSYMIEVNRIFASLPSPYIALNFLNEAQNKRLSDIRVASQIREAIWNRTFSYLSTGASEGLCSLPQALTFHEALAEMKGLSNQKLGMLTRLFSLGVRGEHLIALESEEESDLLEKEAALLIHIRDEHLSPAEAVERVNGVNLSSSSLSAC